MGQSIKKITGVSSTHRVGHWLPADKDDLNFWLDDTIKAAEKHNAPYHPVIKKFEELIETDPQVYLYFSQMFSQVPHGLKIPPHSGDIRIKNYTQMLKVINHVLTTAPEFDTTGMVGCPINAILDLTMNTAAGYAAFLCDKVNVLFKEVLNTWAKFLDSPDSLYVLNTTNKGWMGEAAKKAIKIELFKLQPDEPYWGFKSWNDFFIREFKEGERPVAEPDNDKVIVSACESQPFAISTNVQRYSQFWLKSQPYSLEHMLAGNHVNEFVGGTVYQAFLSAENYHRWHSPVSGIIKTILIKDGTYYSEAWSEGFDPAGPNNSQAYIAHVAARALIFIESKEPVVGLMCFMAIGMVEVSSCKVTVKEGQEVAKGGQLGYFQFGGSTHCLVFRKGAIASFNVEAIPVNQAYAAAQPIVNVNAMIATAN